MNNDLDEQSSADKPSVFIQNAAVLANIPWTLGNIVAFDHNPAMASAFLVSTCVGLVGGQTLTGVVTQFGITYVGHTLMLTAAVQNHDMGQLATAVGGYLINTKLIFDAVQQKDKDNKKKYDAQNPLPQQPYQPVLGPVGMRFKDKLDRLMDIPANFVRKAARKLQESDKLKKFGDNVMDIASRPLFAGAVMGGICDLAYGIGSIKEFKLSVLGAALIWTAGWAVAGLAIPQDGQKNIFQQWFENARDAMTGNKDKPGPPKNGQRLTV